MTTMANLISKRVAKSARSLPRQLNGRSPPHVSARIEAATALEEWETEGGASRLTLSAQPLRNKKL